MNNLRILLYMMLLSLAACHPEGTSVKQGLYKAAQLMEQDPDTASIILETIQSSQMNEANWPSIIYCVPSSTRIKTFLIPLISRLGRRHLIMRKMAMNIKNPKHIIILPVWKVIWNRKRRQKSTLRRQSNLPKKQRNTIIWQKSANDVVFIIRNTVTLMKHWKWRERHTPVS